MECTITIVYILVYDNNNNDNNVYIYIYIHIYTYTYLSLSIYIYIYMEDEAEATRQLIAAAARHPSAPFLAHGASSLLHPIRILSFRSFRTPPLANLTPLPIKQRFLGNPTLGTNLGSRILGMRIGCTHPASCS